MPIRQKIINLIKKKSYKSKQKSWKTYEFPYHLSIHEMQTLLKKEKGKCYLNLDLYVIL